MCQTSSSFQKKSLASELWLFLELAVPTTLLNLGYIISPLLTASYVGRKFGSIFFSGFTLANLTGNLCTFSLMHGLFSATDTLGTQAFGSGNKKKLG
jgi:Na+-driven multidrug efflux pump